MKIFVLAIYFVVFSVFSLQSQNKSVLPSEYSLYLTKQFDIQSITVSTVDTLGKNLLALDSLALYPSVSGGYIAGNNGFGDKAKAQAFKNDTVMGITKVLLLFGKKKYAGNPESELRIRLYSTNGLGKTTQGNNQTGAPKNVLSEKPLPLSLIDTSGGFSEISFNYWSCVVDTDFAVGFAFDAIKSGDTVGVFTGYNGQAVGSEMAWELLENGTWSTLLRSWPLDADLAVFPVIDYSYTSIKKTKKEKKTTVYPNPSSTEVSVIPFRKGNNWKLFLSDINGKMVYKKDGDWKEKLILDISKFPKNIYILTNIVDGIAIQEKLAIE